MDDKQRKNFSQKLRVLRKAMGLTQDEAAGIFFVSRSCWSNYETGDRYPNADLIKNIAEFFGVTVKYLKDEEKLPKEIVDFSRHKSSSFKRLTKQGCLDISELSTVNKVALMNF